MKNLIKQATFCGSHIASSAGYVGILGILFLFAGVSAAHAETYIIDATTPNAECGSFCQQLQAYLSGGNTNNGANNSNSYSSESPYFTPYGNNGSSGQPNGNTGSVYTSGGNPGYAGNGMGGNANASDSTSYPYRVYNYYQNPNPSGIGQNAGPNNGYNNGGYNGYGNTAYNPYGASYNAGAYGGNNYGGGNTYNPYAPRMYVYYGQNGSSTTNRSQNPQYGSNSGSGFVRTSGY